VRHHILFEMVDVTIGQVSAMINAAIVLGMTKMRIFCVRGADFTLLVQLTLPLAIVLAMVGLLRNQETAATWYTVTKQQPIPLYLY
jgi:hypothetical protein